MSTKGDRGTPSEPAREGTGPLHDLSDAGLVSREPVYDGRIVHLSLDTVRFPGGETGMLEMVSHPGASAVVPFLDPPLDADPRIVLVHQYRYAAGGLLYEVPAGMASSSEEPWAQCARRELAEETGYEASDMRYLGRIFTTPGFTDEQIHLFAAHGLRSGAVSRDPDEFLEVVTLRLSEGVEGIRLGTIVDGKSVAALLLASSFRDSLWEANREPPARLRRG